MKYVLSIAFFVGANALTSIAQEANWDQWRGPNKNGSVDSAKPLIEWNLERCERSLHLVRDRLPPLQVTS